MRESRMLLNKLKLVLVLLVAFAGYASADAGGLKPRLACVPFLATSLQAMAFTEQISSTLVNSLDRSAVFEVVERKKIESVLEQEGLRLDNLTYDSIMQTAPKYGIDYVVHGSVNSDGSGVVLELNLINIRSGKRLLQEGFRVSEGGLTQLTQKISERIVEAVKQFDKARLGMMAAGLPGAANLVKPHQLRAAGTSNSIRLTWQYAGDVKAIAGFSIYRASYRDGQFSHHATISQPFYVEENLKLNEEFYYRVAAISLDGRASELTEAVRGATAVAPPSPIFMNIQPDIRGARLAWMPRPVSASDKRMSPVGYRVYRKNPTSEIFEPVGSTGLDSNVFDDVNLEDGAKFVYVVTAVNSEGIESEYSSRLAVVTLPIPAPVNVKGNMIRQVAVNWDKYAAELAEGYVLYRADKRDGKYEVVSRLDGRDVLTYVDKGLADKREYWYRLSVFKKNGMQTSLSAPVSALTRDIPPAPVSLKAQSGEARRVSLSWETSGHADDAISLIHIYRSLTGKDGEFEKIAEVSSDKNRYVDDEKPLQDKSVYYYRLAAQNSGNAVSRFSATVSAVTKAVPLAPADFKAASGEVKRITLSWSKNAEADIKEYRIYSRPAGTAEFKAIAETAENQYVDSGIADGAEVAYKVVAVDRDGLFSGYSAEVIGRTKPLPAKVSGIKVENTANRTISWQPSHQKDVRSYHVYKKGFLGISEKLAAVEVTHWKADDLKGRLELYVTAVDNAGLESEPSEIIVFE